MSIDALVYHLTLVLDHSLVIIDLHVHTLVVFFQPCGCCDC